MSYSTTGDLRGLPADAANPFDPAPTPRNGVEASHNPTALAAAASEAGPRIRGASPRQILATEATRLRDVLLNIGIVLAAEGDDALHRYMDLYGAIIVDDLQCSVDRVRRAQTSIEALRAIARCETGEAA